MYYNHALVILMGNPIINRRFYSSRCIKSSSSLSFLVDSVVVPSVAFIDASLLQRVSIRTVVG
jgi:hypothetical protein